MKKLILFIVFLLISLCSYSQITYPKLIVLDGDTLILIRLEQGRDVNFIFESYRKYGSLNEEKDSIILNLNKKISIKDAIIGTYESDSDAYKSMISSLSVRLKTCEDEYFDCDQKKKFWKTATLFTTTLSVVLLTILLL